MPEEGAGLALENNYIFMETSCFKNTNVSDAFTTLIELTNIDLQKELSNNSVHLRNHPNERRRICC